MSATNDGGPAFPTQNGCRNDPGMTLRDYFAGQALQGIMSSGTAFNAPMNALASDCYKMSAAMLAAREKEVQP